MSVEAAPDNEAAPVRTQVCVAGGGPAGLALALALLRAGVEVAVVERATMKERQFRGEILQPGGQAVLDELGVLDDAKALGHFATPRFTVVDRGRTILDIDYRMLPPPHDHLLSLPQLHMLKTLYERCAAHPGFTYLEGYRVAELSGTTVTVRGRAGSRVVEADCVVGADGRYSKVRKLVGIPDGRQDVFDQDVLWCKLHAPGRPVGTVSVHQAAQRPVMIYDAYPDTVQIGWMLPHGGYAEALEAGAETIVDQLAAGLPRYADLIREQVHDARDFTLLDVFAGCAPQWCADGVVLIGDAAHTHSPLGAQGINLALQDALALAPVLAEAARTGDYSASALTAFERMRRPAVEAMMRFQVRQSRGMLSRGRVVTAMRPVIAGLISRTPLALKITRLVAYGRVAPPEPATTRKGVRS